MYTYYLLLYPNFWASDFHISLFKLFSSQFGPSVSGLWTHYVIASSVRGTYAHAWWSTPSNAIVNVYKRLVGTTTTRLSIAKRRFVSIRIAMTDVWVKHIFYFMYRWINGIGEFLISGHVFSFLTAYLRQSTQEA